jgi:iron complex transport system ATP-binding protein
MSDLLRVDNVGFSFGNRPVLLSISLTAHAGEFIALLGSNGAGKSTLLDIISGIRSPVTGAISIDGRNQKQWSPRELSRYVSHLPQSVHADLPFTAEQLVAMGRYPHTDKWFESEEDHVAVRQAMERTFCGQHRGRRFSSLSGGERQRVLLAACLAQDAHILLLDEPSTFLDIEQQLHCFSLLRDEAQRGKLCIAVTHDLNLALTYCTRLIVLANGVVAHDIAASQKYEDTNWLSVFSPRLRMGATPEGAPWVWYR